MLQHSQNKSNYRIGLFCLVTMFYWFSLYTYVPTLTVYVESLGASHKLAGIITGSYGFTQMLLRIPVGIYSDRFHQRKLFINFGLFFALFSAAGLRLTKDLTLILVFRALAGAAAATWVDFTILFTSYYKHEESTKAIGTITFFNSLGQMSGMMAGSWIAESYGWIAPFWLGAAGGIIGLALSFFLVENFEDSPVKVSSKELINVIRDPLLIIVSTLAVLSQLITFATVYGFTPAFAQETLHASKLDMGLLTVFATLPTAFASLIGGRYLSQRFGEKAIVIGGFILMSVFTLTIPFTTTFWLMLITQALAGLGRGFSFPALMSLSIKHMPSEKRATAMGFFQSIYGLGMFLGPVIMGIVGDTLNLQQGFILFGIIGCATALLSGFAIKQKY